MNCKQLSSPSACNGLRTTARRSVERAVLGRWLKRLRVADAIVFVASVEADALLTIWEFMRCALSHYSLRC